MKNGPKVATAAGGLALVLLAAVAAQHALIPAKKVIDSSGLQRALNDAKQPASVVAGVRVAADKGDGCQYAEVASRAALDANLQSLVPPLLDAAPAQCPRSGIFQGQRAEALARAGLAAQAETVANEALKADLTNGYAQLALALAAYDKNQMTQCSTFAGQALLNGRGKEAERLIGRAALAQGKFTDAESHFQAVLKADTNDVEAAFSAGVCNDKLGRYHQAREAFLLALHIDPKHIEARKYLVLLAHRAGANDEARHHLQKLAELLPKDSPLLKQLEQLLSGSSADDAGAPTEK
jgi:tetratricopeptide (TPR) repeat protein